METEHRILLVEDNDINRELASHVLGLAGMQVETAADGQEAVKRFLESSIGFYDMIFMDIQMPVMDGYAATRAIRQSHRADKGLPIIALTANASEEDAAASKAAGMDDHVVKPLKIQAVREVLDKWLKVEPT
jgi:CheY-like chemotaxis protein